MKLKVIVQLTFIDIPYFITVLFKSAKLLMLHLINSDYVICVTM